MPRGIPNKPHTETNPDCINPACLITCNEQCPNLKDNIDWERAQREDRDPLEEGVVTSR
jgi:hypothetical protein